MSLVHADVTAACPFSIAEDYAQDYLRSSAAGGMKAEIRLPVRLFVLRRLVSMRFGLRSDRGESGRPHDEIRLAWEAHSPWLPDFHGVVRMRIAGTATRLVLSGNYVPPGGLLGRVFDVLIGRHIARAGCEDFLARLAMYLEQREGAWRGALGPIEAPVG